MPYTPAGKEAFLANKPGFDGTMAPMSQMNDSFDTVTPSVSRIWNSLIYGGCRLFKPQTRC